MVDLQWPPAVAVLILGSRLDWFAVLQDRDAPRAVVACELFFQLRSKKERGADAMLMHTLCTTPWVVRVHPGQSDKLSFLPSLSCCH